MEKGKTKEDIKDLDLRSMPPFERHEKIFEVWNSLKEGQTMKIINDHDPKPLHYQFEAEYNGKYEWKYEKQGPKDWIVKIKKAAKGEGKKEEIKELLKQLHSGADIKKIREKGKAVFKNISPTELALVEQEIINEGTTRDEMRKLCDVHLEIMKEGLGKIDIKLKPGHPIHTLTEEHKVILEFVKKLEHVVGFLGSKKDFNKVSEELEMLKHIAEHLVEADKHHQREEDVLFPMLEKYGVTEPPAIMMEEHKDLKQRKKELNEIANRHKMQYPYFVKKVKELAEYIIKELPNHIYKEDNILYPMALKVIPENKWAKIKADCDKIGYCCFTPAC